MQKERWKQVEEGKTGGCEAFDVIVKGTGRAKVIMKTDKKKFYFREQIHKSKGMIMITVRERL